MQGRVHSLESFGTVDGPGVRYVVFLQGCPMRCAYCHNPDTWSAGGGTLMDTSEIMKAYDRNRGFYREGGITVTGGEPMLQLDFVTELFTLAQEKDIHTCIDTSGVTFDPDNPAYMRKLDKLLDVTNLVMLDIKHIKPEKHLSLTGQQNDNILAFTAYLDSRYIPFWIRHVVVPGLSDDDDDLFDLGYFIGQFHSLKALDVLPYHTMGVAKYEKLGIPYRLEGVPPMDKALIAGKKECILNGIRKRRSEIKNQK